MATTRGRWPTLVASLWGPHPRSDLLAGLAVGVVVVPQSLAYAKLAGMAPVVGLYAALAALVAYAVVGSSPAISLGPTATSAILAAAAGDAVRGESHAGAVTAAALLAGGVAVGAGLARLGFVANLLSRPVLLGYTTGAALVIAGSQVGHLLGADLSGRYLPQLVAELPGALGAANLPTVAVAATSLAVLVLLPRWLPRWPASLVVVAGGIVAATVLNLAEHGVVTVGVLPRGLPTLGVADVAWADLELLALPVLAIVLVGFAETVGQARVLAGPQERVDANRELTALGAANLASGAVGGFAVSSSFSRNALNQRAGGRTKRAGLVAAGVVVVSVLVFTGLLARLPMAVLAAVVVHAVARLVSLGTLRRLARFQRDEFVLALVAAGGVVALGILPGLAVAVTLSIGVLLYRVSSMDAVVLGYVPDQDTWRRLDRHPAAREVPETLVVRFSGPLYFANAPRLQQEVTELVAELPTELPEGLRLRRVIIEARGISHIDSTAMGMLAVLHGRLAGEGVELVMAGLRGAALDAFLRSDLVREVGEERLVWPTVRSATQGPEGQDLS